MKTFEQIIKEMCPNEIVMLTMTEIKPLMQLVREQTLKECAEKVTLTQDEIMINSLDRNSLDL